MAPLISLGTISHVLRPLNLMVSVPLLTVLTCGTSQHLSLLNSYEEFCSLNMFCIGNGERWFFTLYISVANFCKFLSWTVKELSNFSSKSKIDYWFDTELILIWYWIDYWKWKECILIVFVPVYQVMYYWLLNVKRVHINSFCARISVNVLFITESEKSTY